MAIRIDFLSNVRPFLQGTDDVDGALQKVGGSLDELAAESKSSGEKTASGVTSAASKIGATFRDLAATARSTFRGVTSADRESTAAFEVSGRERKKIIRETYSTVPEQGKQAATQAAASFTGNLNDIAGSVQGVLAGLAASNLLFAPIFAVAAGVIGTIQGQLQTADEETEAWQADVAAVTQELIDVGSKGTVPLDAIVKKLQQLATETDKSKVSLSSLDDVADRSHNSFTDVAEAYAGNTAGLKTLLEEQKKKLASDKALADTAKTGRAAEIDAIVAGRQHRQTLLEQKNAQQDYVDYLQKSVDKVSDAAKAEKLYAEAGGPQLELKKNLIDQVNTAYDDAAGSVEDFVGKESGVLDVGKYIAAMQAKQKALRDYQTNLAQSGLSDDAKSFLASEGADAAATLIAGYKSASPQQQAELAQIWSEAGKTSSGAFTNALDQNLPKSVQIPVVLDLAKALNTLDNLFRPRTVRVTASPAGRLAERLL